jgi:uncharacterized membrane protein
MFLWLLNHVISLIPVWMWAFTAGSGAAAFFVSGMVGRWPGIKPYAMLTRYIGLVVFTVSVFMMGGVGVNTAMQDAIKEAEAKVAKAEEASKDLNTKLEASRKEKQKVRVEYYATVKTQIKEVEKRINAECKVDSTINDLFNKAATNPEAKQ